MKTKYQILSLLSFMIIGSAVFAQTSSSDDDKKPARSLKLTPLPVKLKVLGAPKIKPIDKVIYQIPATR